MPDKLQKLQELIKIANEGLTREEFLSNFKAIIELVKKMKAENQQQMMGIEDKYDSIVSNIKNNYSSDMQAVKSEALAYCMSEMKDMLKQHGKDMSTQMDMLRAECMPDTEKIASVASETVRSEVLPLIPTIDQIGEKLPELGRPIRDGLELLPIGEKLKIEAIEKLRDELDELAKKIRSISFSGGTVGGVNGGGHIVKVYDLSSSLDGLTKTFTIPAAWRILMVTTSSFPNTLRPTTDFTHDTNASTITFTSEIDATTTLAVGQTVIILYSE